MWLRQGERAEGAAITSWEAGSFQGRTPRLLFGRMYEDCEVELQSFAPHSRLFCIAAAGCTAATLAAAGLSVTAVDVNPAQIAYAQSRARGEPARPGSAERLLSGGRALLNLAGWTESKRREFLSLSDPGEQIAYWDRKLDSTFWRAVLDAVLSPSLLRLAYRRPFLDSLPRNFGACVRARMRRCWAAHPNRSNPYAWELLLGERPAVASLQCFQSVRFVCADAAAYLERCSPASFDAFSLSNIVDGASSAYIERLWKAVRHAAAPGAVVVSRSLAEPGAATRSNWAARDRSFLWGVVDVFRLGGSS